MKKPPLKSVVSVENLPSLPEVANRIVGLARDSQVDVDQLVNAVCADPAMTAKVLKTANSVLFGRQFNVNSVQAALPVLGSTLLRTLVLGFSLTKQEQWTRYESSFRTLWQRTLIHAHAAELLSERVPQADSRYYFSCGLVQDIGSIAMLSAYPALYSQAVLSDSDIHRLAHVERQHFGFSHVDVSVGLWEKWKLSPDAVDALKSHHEPLQFLRSRRQETSHLAEAMKVASYCTHYYETKSEKYETEFLESLSRMFAIDRQEMTDFFDRLDTRISRLTDSYDRDLVGLPPIEEIVGNAKVAIEEVAIQSQIEASQAIDKNDWLQKQIARDPLTGVGNRRALETSLDDTIRNAKTDRAAIGILFFDLDNFKQHNDVFGHDAGDDVLKAFVKVLENSLRRDDLIVRYGGDEFIAICVGPSFERLNAIAAKICESFARRFEGDGALAPLSVSVGGAHCSVESLDDLNLSNAILEADQNMYCAKRKGGNQWHVAKVANAKVSLEPIA